MKAWYFSNSDRRLRYGDGRKIKAGTVHTVDCKPILCEQGLHGSINILDALYYAPGPYIWRVNLSGDVVRGEDKIVATSREYVWGFDATETLRKFARMCALDVIHLWDAPDIVVRYLKTGDESIRDAARDASWDASWDAAWATARAAARATARDAAWDAARDAAWAAARATARDAAWDAAREKQSRRLYRMIMNSGRR